jgi:ribosomal subunit interface protein
VQSAPEIYFKNMDASDIVQALIEERIRKLERLFDKITSCHVYVAAPHQQHRTGNRYEITVEVRVPGTELVVNDNPGDVRTHDDVRVAVRDAFDAMERQLKKWKDKIKGETKVHDGPLQGRVVEVDRERGFGQIVATDGQLVYFHPNSVINCDFASLEPRDHVELVVQTKESEIGPQASTVKRISAAQFEA